MPRARYSWGMMYEATRFSPAEVATPDRGRSCHSRDIGGSSSYHLLPRILSHISLHVVLLGVLPLELLKPPSVHRGKWLGWPGCLRMTQRRHETPGVAGIAAVVKHSEGGKGASTMHGGTAKLDKSHCHCWTGPSEIIGDKADEQEGVFSPDGKMLRAGHQRGPPPAGCKHCGACNHGYSGLHARGQQRPQTYGYVRSV